jgi:hypothetical protein
LGSLGTDLTDDVTVAGYNSYIEVSGIPAGFKLLTPMPAYATLIGTGSDELYAELKFEYDPKPTGASGVQAAATDDYVAKFLSVASTYNYDLETLLYLDWLLGKMSPSGLSSVYGTPEYSRFKSATASFARASQTVSYGDVSVSVSGLPWNVRLSAWAVNSGTSFNSASAAAGSRAFIASVALDLTQYKLVSAAESINFKASSKGTGIVALNQPNLNNWGGYYNGYYGYSQYVVEQPFNYGYNPTGFFGVNVAVSNLAQYRNIVVLDGEVFGYAPITGASQSGTTISFSTNHTGYFWIYGTKASDNPQTADSSNSALYSMLALVSLAGIAVVNRKRAFSN